MNIECCHGAEIWIVGIYIFAASVAVKFFLPIDFEKARFRPKIILILFVQILFPLWLPFTAWRKGITWSERRSYLALEDEYLNAVEQVST